MPEPQHRVRTWVLFAREARKAVILRRGPKTHFRLIGWNLRDDSFMPGQWMKGHVALHDLSPRGDKLIYWARQWGAAGSHWRQAEAAERDDDDALDEAARARRARKRKKRRKVTWHPKEQSPQPRRERPRTRFNEGLWTAISTPPYFSALAIWPSYGHWTGGGIFVSDTDIVLLESADGMTPKVNVPIPGKYRFHAGLESDAPYRFGARGAAERSMPEASIVFQSISAGLKRSGARYVDWVADRGDLLFACDGAVYRLKTWRERDPNEFLAAATRIADFRDMAFEPIAPPRSALRW